MKNIQYTLFLLICITSIFIIPAHATLYVDANVGDMKKIDESKYKASAVSIVRNENGELVSVIRIDASRYLDDSIVDEFLNSDPGFLVKQGKINNEKVNLYRTSVEYYKPTCIEEIFDVPGYNDECDWYHRAFVTMLGVTNDDDGERFILFRGLNHGFFVKPLYEVTTIWDIITKE